MKFNWKKIIPHIVAIVVFYLLAIVYFAPEMLDGKALLQSDIVSWKGMGQDIRNHAEKTGEVSFWTNGMFGGMPGDFCYGQKQNSVFKQVLAPVFEGFLPAETVGIVFAYMIGFYIFMLAIGCSPWLSIFGALAYAFCSYNIIIIEAGHVTKALVMSTIAPIAGGVILCYRKRYTLGALITLIAVGMNICWNHQQISYYVILMLVCAAISYLVYAIKEKEIKHYLAASLILLCVASLAVTPALDRLIPTMDYSKETMRGGAVLQNNKEGEKEHAGLDIDYAYMWSYGKAETMTLLIPNFYGGSSHYNIGNDSHFYEALKPTGQASAYSKAAPMYWGDQPFTSGPVYGGAIICFLFVLGLMMCKGKERWWLLAATILGILLSWGRNLPSLNNWLFYNLPLYSKFRTPSMALVISNFTMAALAMMCIKSIVDRDIDKKKANTMLYIAFGVVGGLCLIFALFGSSMFSFEGKSDAQLPDWAVSALVQDRQDMLSGDAWRSFWFILLAAAMVWLYQNDIVKKSNIAVIVIGMLCFIDVWGVAKRFLNESSFVPERQVTTIEPTEIDKQIMEDEDPDYRVLNLTTNTFNESRTSYFHKSVGGYSAAKLRRYQDIIDYHLSGNISWPVINMLNTKYIIFNTEQGPRFQRNFEAMGNCWFVDSIRWQQSPDEEIVAIGKENLRNVATMDVEWRGQIKNESALTGRDSAATIELTEYANPGKLVYQSSSNKAQLAVFSEVYYKTWKCYIDGEKVPIERANYILRAVEVPAGNHEIVFECVDDTFMTWHKWSLVASILVSVVALGLIALIFYNKRKETVVEKMK